ncbi:hypothetical protein AURDEDRAFT_126967 [Auricularia subglabra TFB-10046 SS5]|nr:hypothetical protein AURDEDRAFT_126967 [Auricularia subglabra TFB-10046 SS5]
MNSASSVFLAIPDTHAAELALVSHISRALTATFSSCRQPDMQRSVSYMPITYDRLAFPAHSTRARRRSPLSMSFLVDGDAAAESSSALSVSASSAATSLSARSSESSLPVSASSSTASKASVSSAFSRLAKRLNVVSRLRRRGERDFDRDQAAAASQS